MATIYPQYPTASRSFGLRRTVTLEQVLYLAIGILAILLHLYLLGFRSLHHDETLHAQFSWRLYKYGEYTHDPLLHGPFLYYLTAGIYLLFGDSDTTARLPAALFGIGLTLLPMLLRRDIGRGSALLASVYLLISPIALYVGRFIRHDIFAVVFEVLVVAGLLQYVRTERDHWHYVVAIAAALMLTTMETFYLFMLIVGSFVVIWLLWQVSLRVLALLCGYLAVAALAVGILPNLRGVGPLPTVSADQALTVRNAPDNNWNAYFQKVGDVLAPFWHHPAVLVVLVATVVFLGAAWVLLWGVRDAQGRSAWRRAADAAEPGTLVHAVDNIPGRRWSAAFGAAFGIYAVLFTGFLSNLVHPNLTGLVTGVSGSFLYWLGQHGVRRGGQPAHFYLFELGLYEPLLILGGLAGLGLLVARTWQWLRAGRIADDVDVSMATGTTPRPLQRITHERLFAPLLLGWWSLGAFLIYSWAGEKMPWLTLHLVVPLALLSAWAIGQIGGWALRYSLPRTTWATIGGGMLLMVVLLLQLNTIGMGGLPAQIATAWIWPVGAFLFFWLAIAIAGTLDGTRAAVATTIGLVLILLLPYTIRSNLRLAYETGDVAVEPMVFVQTSPDVARVMRQLDRATSLFGRVHPLGVRYDNETVWQWYLRNRPNTIGSGSTIIGPVPPEVQVVFMLQENEAANKQYLSDFVGQRFPLRWWLPECDIYRFPKTDVGGSCDPKSESLLSRLVSHPFDGQTIVDWWQFALFRKIPAPLSSTDWVLYVRTEVADLFGMGTGTR